jgi:hypothetical protein
MSRLVLSSPDATPLCVPATPCMATMVAGTSVKPMPSAVRSAPASTAPAYVCPGPMPVNSAIPAPDASIAATITARGPNRATARGASVELMKIVSVHGRKLRPAPIAL